MGKPKKHRVEWTHTADADLRAIVEYVAQDSLPSGSCVLDKLEQTAQTLATAPLRGQIVPELAGVGVQTYRELIVSPWQIIYRLSGSRVYVLAVLDGRRNLEDVLLERFLR